MTTDEDRTGVRERVEVGGRAHHHHVIESAIGDPQSYRDEPFRSRRRALEVARDRANWLNTVAGCRVDSLGGASARYLITTGRPHDAGRMIVVEECYDRQCPAIDGL